MQWLDIIHILSAAVRLACDCGALDSSAHRLNTSLQSLLLCTACARMESMNSRHLVSDNTLIKEDIPSMRTGDMTLQCRNLRRQICCEAGLHARWHRHQSLPRKVSLQFYSKWNPDCFPYRRLPEETSLHACNS